MRNQTLSVVVAGLLSGCLTSSYTTEPIPDPAVDSGGTSQIDGGVVDASTSEDAASPITTCAPFRSYPGFGGTKLEADRVVGSVDVDRDRVKPYEVLAGELTRVLGAKPPLIDAMASTFEAAPPRWFIEPQATAVTLYSSYRVAFTGALTYTATGTEYAAAPTAASAQTECVALATTFWSRTPEQSEVDACIQLAVNDSVTEPNARRRWAYTAAAVLSAAGFLTY